MADDRYAPNCTWRNYVAPVSGGEMIGQGSASASIIEVLYCLHHERIKLSLFNTSSSKLKKSHGFCINFNLVLYSLRAEPHCCSWL
jgi:hypothetical protein